MRETPEIWQVPASPPEVLWVARAAWLLVLALALIWLAFAVYDLAWQGLVNGGQMLALLSVLLWFIWVWHLRQKHQQTVPLILHWFEEATPFAQSRLPRKIAQPTPPDSHWRTADGQAVALTVTVDLGSHVLVRMGVGRSQTYQWVRDKDVSGPWRWRIMADMPKQIHTQKPKHTPQAKKRGKPVVIQTRDKDAWHHR